MKKLESDIARAMRDYIRTAENLQNLVDLQEVHRLSETGFKPNLVNVTQYGAYLHGVQMACEKILRDNFTQGNGLASKDDRLVLEAELKLVLESKLSADRWITGYPNMMLEPVKKDKSGKAKAYKASWYMKKSLKVKL